MPNNRLIPDVSARVRRRLIFNFRVTPEAFAAFAPRHLTAHQIDGAAIASFCFLELDSVRFGVVPAIPGMRSYHCAYRFGARSVETGVPIVYVPERHVCSALGSFMTGFRRPRPHSNVRVEMQSRDDNSTQLVIHRGNSSELLFDVRFTDGVEFRSTAFDSIDLFSQFMSAGVRSHSPSRQAGRFTEVDLFKKESSYTPHDVKEVRSPILDTITNDYPPLAFDSALATDCSEYRWHYRGVYSFHVEQTCDVA